jgi:hypothetical protein
MRAPARGCVSLLFASSLLLACFGKTTGDVLGEAGPAAADGASGGGQSSRPSFAGGAAGASSECDAFAVKYCAKAETCNALDARMYGASCTDRIANICKAQISAPGSGLTSKALAWCGDRYAASATCDAAFSTFDDAPCPVAGSRAIEEDCVFDVQCASGYCGGVNDTALRACGRCAPAPASPKAPFAGLGEACKYDADNEGPGCNTSLGHWCNIYKNECEEISFASEGGTCGYMSSGGLVLCEPGSACSWGEFDSGGSWCVPEQSAGEACVAGSRDEQCAAGMSCIDRTCAYVTYAGICH